MIKINRDEITNYYNISARKYYSCISDALNKYDDDKILKIKRNHIWVDSDLCDIIFTRKRRPNQRDINGIKRYIMSKDMDYIGVIRPNSYTSSDCLSLIENLFNLMVKETNPKYCYLYYTLERNIKQHGNRESEAHHIHFLIETDVKTHFIQPSIRIIKQTMQSGNPWIEKYSYKKHKESGKIYNLKEIDDNSHNKIGYLSFRRRNNKSSGANEKEGNMVSG